MDDTYFMRQALAEARQAAAEDEILQDFGLKVYKE